MSSTTTTIKRSQLVEIWQRLIRNKMAMLGLAILLTLIGLAVLAPVLFDYDTQVVAQDLSIRLQGPSAAHWFGTDEFGRDIFVRMVYGARVSLVVGLISVSVSLVIGGCLGAFAGFYGGKLVKLPTKDCRTLAIEIGIQNSGLALALLFNPAIFDPTQWTSNGGMVIVAALWGIWHIISGLSISYLFRRRKA